MPFTILLRLALIAILLFLFVNVVIPLIFPQYRFFWLFRGKRAKALRSLDNAKEREEIAELQPKNQNTRPPAVQNNPHSDDEA